VRDLYGTVVNEGATKGILVTTSSFGPEAHAFAKGKPLTLFDGGNLLHLLEQHGRRAYIDLAEAKKLNTSPLARTLLPAGLRGATQSSPPERPD
jgi:restriction system protein